MIITSGFIWTVATGGMIFTGAIVDLNGYYPA